MKGIYTFEMTQFIDSGWLLYQWENIWNGRYKNYILLAVGLVPVVKGCVSVIQIIYKRQRDAKALAQFDGPAPHWFYGNLSQIKPGKLHQYREEQCKIYGDVFIMHISVFNRQVVFGSGKAVQSLLSTGEPKSQAYRFVEPWIGNGLLMSSGKKWSRNRRLLASAFHFDILKPYQKLHSESSQAMIEKLQTILKNNPEESIEIFEHVSLLTLDSLMKCIFGMNGNYQKLGRQDPYINTIYDITMLSVKRFLQPLHYFDLFYYLSYDGYKFRKACKFVHNFSKEVIAKKRKVLDDEEFQKTAKHYIDFIDILMTCKDSEGNGLSDDDIEEEVNTFMFAGHDTTASGISWCLQNLAKHPNFQQKCREEINEILGERNEVTWDDLNQLNFLGQCIKESLRLCPPATGVGRNITKPITLYDGRVIPAGTWCVADIYCTHRNPADWPNPNKFDPKRFDLEASKNRHPYAFVPFSAGPRNCIGQNFAMNEMKTVLALLIKSFNFKVDTKNNATTLFSLVLRAEKGLYLKVTPLQ